MASGALSRAGDFHAAQFLGGERSHDTASSDGDVPEEHLHAGRGCSSRNSELARRASIRVAERLADSELALRLSAFLLNLPA